MAINRPATLIPETKVFDRYTVIKSVGQGGLGTVYQIRDMTDNRIYALKETFDLSTGARDQFEREARWLERLDHPNIPKVRQFFEWQNRLYLVMDFISGENLEHMLVKNGHRPLPEADVWQWIAPICDAISYMHSQHPPIIHRDVKPANIIVTSEGLPHLVDLGIAKEHVPGLPNLTATFVRKAGTEGYAPPEQYTSQGKTGPWSDIYSLGATIYHLLTGQIPASPIDRAALDGQLIMPRHLNPAISPMAESLILRALALRPSDRYAKMQDMYQAVIDTMNALNAKPRPQPPAQMQQQIRGSGPLTPPYSRPAVFQSPPNSPQRPLTPSFGLNQGAVQGNSLPPMGTSSAILPPSSISNSTPRLRGDRVAKPIERRRGAAKSGAGSMPAPPSASNVGAPSSSTSGWQSNEQRAAALSPTQRRIRVHQVSEEAPRRHVPRVLVIGLLAVIVILMGTVFLINNHMLPFMNNVDHSSVNSVAKSYFTSLENHDYNGAYQCFSPNVTGTISSDDYARRMQDTFTSKGDIKSFSIAGTTAGVGNTTVLVNVTYSTAGVQPVSLTFVQINGTWYLDAIP
jgi:eukaryotic-like serine/threonine-protein kinase